MSDEKQKSDHEKLAQMLERVMRIAEMLAQRSQSSDNASAADEKTQHPRSAVQ